MRHQYGLKVGDSVQLESDELPLTACNDCGRLVIHISADYRTSVLTALDRERLEEISVLIAPKIGDKLPLCANCLRLV